MLLNDVLLSFNNPSYMKQLKLPRALSAFPDRYTSFFLQQHPHLIELTNKPYITPDTQLTCAQRSASSLPISQLTPHKVVQLPLAEISPTLLHQTHIFPRALDGEPPLVHYKALRIMSRHLSFSEASPSPPSPHADAVLIEIPAVEFSNLANASNTPPSRLTERVTKPPTDWETKQNQAAMARKASQEALRHRCKEHIDHVVSVVKFVKESRKQTSQARHQQLRSMQRHAAERRRRFLMKRADDMAEARARRARIARERSEERRRADARSASIAREEAAERRGRILSERKIRASRFSPTRGMSLSPVRSFSPNSVITESVESPISRSVADVEDEELTSESGNSSPNSPMGIDRISKALPAQRAGNMVIEDRKYGNKRVLNAEKTKAARKILAYYFLAKARKAMSEAGVLGEKLRTHAFEDTTACLEKDEAQNAADLVFRALGMRRVGRRMTKNTENREKAERRILLSCLLISLHPGTVMEEKVRSAVSEAQVSVDMMAVYSARRMLLCLQAGSVSAVAVAWMGWRKAFLKWKENDAENLLKAMIEDAVATEALRAAVDRTFSETENIEKVKSSLGESDTSLNSWKQEHAVWQEQLNLKQEMIRESVLKLSGSSGEKRLDAALAASRHVQDEHIVHEIMVDLPGLLERVQSSPATSEEEWNRLQRELSFEPHARGELAVRLAHLSKLLNTMIPECFSLIGNESYVELNLDYAVGLVSRAVEALEKCQAQVYDVPLQEWCINAVQRLREAGSSFGKVVANVLQELTEYTRAVRIEVLTCRIRHSAPIVQQFGAAWERSHFQGHIVSGRFSSSLPHTKKVISETLKSIGNESDHLLQEVIAGSPKAMSVIITHTIVYLAMRPNACTEHNIPELMHLDVERVWKMQNEAQKCALISSLFNIGRQFLQSKGLVNIAVDVLPLATLFDRYESKLVDIQDGFIAWIDDIIWSASKQISTSERDLLRGMVVGITRPGDATFSLMHKRVAKAVLERCLREFVNRNVVAGPSHIDGGGEGKERCMMGLEEVESRIEELSRTARCLVCHLQSVHFSSLLSLFKTL